MKRTIIIHGLIAGAIVSTLMLSSVIFLSHSEGKIDFDTGMLIGYASMLLSFSLVFVGIRNYRENYNNKVISFGKAFKIGIIIVLIASTIYVIAWLIAYYFFMPDFIDHYMDHMIKQLHEAGTSQLEIDKQVKEMSEFAIMYQNPLFNAAMTYMEILPVGLAVTLISSLILKKKAKTA